MHAPILEGAWQQAHAPTTGNKATCVQPAGGANVRNVCRSIVATVACGATAQTDCRCRAATGRTERRAEAREHPRMRSGVFQKLSPKRCVQGQIVRCRP
jgi:hypothetical protein